MGNSSSKSKGGVSSSAKKKGNIETVSNGPSAAENSKRTLSNVDELKKPIKSSSQTGSQSGEALPVTLAAPSQQPNGSSDFIGATLTRLISSSLKNEPASPIAMGLPIGSVDSELDLSADKVSRATATGETKLNGESAGALPVKPTTFSPPPPLSSPYSKVADSNAVAGQEGADHNNSSPQPAFPTPGRRSSPPPSKLILGETVMAQSSSLEGPAALSSSFKLGEEANAQYGAGGIPLDQDTLNKLGDSMNNLLKSPTGAVTAEVDIDSAISRLLDVRNNKSGKTFCLKNNEIIYICYKVRDVLLEQSCLLELNPPVNIVGDIHGQYDDLLRIFDILGYPPSTNYLFLGDYVDRGKQSLETILLLLCFKIKYPENFFILRGNHECASVNRVYGFYDECKRRCSLKIWKVFTDVFNCLPIAAVVAGKIFCVHGGLSPSLNTMNDIRMIQRPTDVPDFGLLNDLLWSDPSDTAIDWEDNERGVSYCFGKAILADFLSKHEFDLVARAHIVVEDGYEFFGDRTLVTIFSAPNYCGEFDNKGAVMAVNDDLLCSFELLQPQSSSKYQVKKRRASPPSIK